jgi:hypothetical protein
MAIPFISVEEWRDEFGSKSEAAFELLVPSLFYVKNGQVYLQLSLSKFDEMFDLFQVDPELVVDSVEISDALVGEMDEVDPEIVTTLMSICFDRLGYSPLEDVGSFGITFKDFSRYYGDSFAKDMKELYPYYDNLQSYLSIQDSLL